MRILLVEDDFLIGDGIKTGLEKLGFNIDWFQDGEDGEEALLQAPYDAVILDLGLPGKDGLEILQSWRAKRPQRGRFDFDCPRRRRPADYRTESRGRRLFGQAFFA